MQRTAFSRIWMARQQEVPRIEVYRALRGLRKACAAGSEAGVIEALTMAVADYEPSEAVAVARQDVASDRGAVGRTRARGRGRSGAPWNTEGVPAG